MENTRKQVQGLAWIARYAPLDQVVAIAGEAEQYAAASSNAYGAVMAMTSAD